jgi:hypothetical protein
VNNFRKGASAYSSLDSFVNNMHLRDIAEQQVRKLKLEQVVKSDVKEEPMEVDA